MTLAEFQRLIDATFGAKDRGRGLEGTFMWFTEEVGELSRALRRNVRGKPLEEEFADVLAWLSTLASIAGVDLEAAARAKYGGGCPRCGGVPCRCAEPARPAGA
ncbi:MAG: nucleotide pyrophosphohydrolase [Planctomycetes bacterium]|nr:nucleotide pyrophosphohydrolase [Planctomycetota bacterium]